MQIAFPCADEAVLNIFSALHLRNCIQSNKSVALSILKISSLSWWQHMTNGIFRIVLHVAIRISQRRATGMPLAYPLQPMIQCQLTSRSHGQDSDQRVRRQGLTVSAVRTDPSVSEPRCLSPEAD